MEVVKKAIDFNIDQVVAEEVPYMSAFYRSGSELNSDIHDLLSFPVANHKEMPFYTIFDETTYTLNKQFEDYYEMMKHALTVAFNDKSKLRKFFDCEFLRKHGDRFIQYAEATFFKNHPALYGRYDAAFDPETENLKGVYEFNGDTPVMLFESVNLQSRFADQMGTDQYNNYWDIFIEQMSSKGYKNIGIVCDTAFVEDMATTDTLCQAFKAALPEASVKFLDIGELDFDSAAEGSPFFAQWDDNPLDAVYILSPWEEMVSNFPAMLDNWESWIDHVHIFEPAWRWFFAHKGMTALCTHLMDIDYDNFYLQHYSANQILIPAYLQSEFTPAKGKWVEKPVVGRLSNNIRIWSEGEVESDTGGYYTGENTIFQAYCPPGKVGGRNNFILGMWMCGQYSASLCFREFDTEVLSISNERFVPHIVV